MSTPTAFRSKVDWWLALPLLGIPGSQIAMQWTQVSAGSPPASLWVALAVVAMVVVAFFPVRYVIEGDTVSIRCGLPGWEYSAFRVEEVQSVRSTHNPLASPALSLDRLSVNLRFRGEILISPKDKAGFLRALRDLDAQLRLQDDSLTRGA